MTTPIPDDAQLEQLIRDVTEEMIAEATLFAGLDVKQGTADPGASA